MGELIIKNGVVFDPLNNIKDEKKDICIRDGKIVDDVKNPTSVDVNGLLVLPGGFDGHSHIAGTKVNTGRLIRPEDGRRGLKPKTSVTLPSSGYSVKNVFSEGYDYSIMGYTTVVEPAMPPLSAMHTHEELRDIPMLDKLALPLFGFNWFVMKYVGRGEIDKLAAYVAWVLKTTKGYGIKIVNPGGGENWKWGKNVNSLDDQVIHFGVTPREILNSLMEVSEILDLPHPIHVHTNRLGQPGNYDITVNTMELASGFQTQRDREPLHITHVMFGSYGGENWKTFDSRSDAIAKEVNSNKYATIDMGQLLFGDTTTMTGDGALEFSLQKLTGFKWSNSDTELETGGGVTPEIYSPTVPVNVIQWAIGMEAALLINDPYQVWLTTDHPNGAPFTRYPEIISLLMSKERREKEISQVNNAVNKRAILPSLDREYDWNEIAIITRAAQAKSYQLREKGHLGVGADADVAIYDIRPEEVDPSKEYDKVEKAFSATKYTIKGGEIVVKDGNIVKVVSGKTYWTNAEFDGYYELIEDDLKDWFANYYTVSLNNYGVSDVYLTNPCTVKTNPKIGGRIEKEPIVG